MEVTRIRELTPTRLSVNSGPIVFVEMEVTRIRELTQPSSSFFPNTIPCRNGSYPNKGIDTIISNMHPAMIIM